MSIAPDKRRHQGAFTLLEVTLAVAILAMMSLSIYRFVQTNVTAIRVASDSDLIDAQYSGFANLITAQWQSLAPGTGALLGEPLKLNERSRDEITWTCGAGPGLLTRYAAGDFQVSMRLRPLTKNSEEMEIGVMRKPKGESDVAGENESWVSLLPGVQSMQIRYFDPRLNAWVDKWTDSVTLPRLVKIEIGRANNAVPWETIVALGRTPL